MSRMAHKKPRFAFSREDMDDSVRAQDDFYQYAGGGWMKRNEIPKTESRWGSFTMLRHKTDEQLKALFEKLSAKRAVKHGSAEQMIRDFYRSGLDLKERAKRGLTPLADDFAIINAIGKPSDIVPAIAKLENRGGGGAWGFVIDQDMKDSTRYALYMTQGGLGLPDRDYYLKDDQESVRVRTAYRAFLETIIAHAGSSEASKDADRVLALETKLAHAWMRKEDAREVDKTYHPMSVRALGALVKNVRWADYFKAIGAPVTRVVVSHPPFLKAVGRLFASVPVEDWKTYLRTHLIIDTAGLLTPELEAIRFDFYGKVLMGQPEQKPLWRRVLNVVNGSLGEAVGELYVREYFPPEAKKRIVAVVDDLFSAYEARIKGLDWMSAATKKKALTKLHMMARKLGYPEKWKSYKGLVIEPGDYAGNALRAAVYEQKRELRKLAKKVDRKEWLMTPQTVNAYCNFGTNDIAFPAAILQPPFFDFRATDDAVNYGCIGAVIGHEITHGFDDQGSKFDGLGNRKTWWTKDDRKRFDTKAKVLVRQFNAYEVGDGVNVNGQLTLGENIADLGGASIAFDAYQKRLSKTGRADLEGFTPEQRFFLGFAMFERELSRPEFTKLQALSDPHSPAPFRINGPASNLPEFYEAFGVKKGDKLYRESKDRAKIW